MKKKRKIKKSAKLLLIILLLLIIGLITHTKYDNIYLKYILKYNKETIDVFKKENIIKEVKSKKYSKTLEQVIANNKYNNKYLDAYINIKYIDKKDFINNITLLLNLGYKSKDINNIYLYLNDDIIKLLTTTKYDKNINNYLSCNYFNEKYLNRYLNYNLKNNNLSSEEIITHVNIGLDNDYYTNTMPVSSTNDNLILVNKYNYLSSDYIPNNLTIIDSKYSMGTQKLKKEAVNAFEEMANAALKENIKILVGSGYRSYNYQLNLYNRYVSKDGKSKADTYSARAGYSEHQTGLAIDIISNNVFIDKNETKDAYTWLINNSYKYGYILRYPENKEKTTGYMFEDWHYRYLGIDVATYLYNNTLTLDEYIAKKAIN